MSILKVGTKKVAHRYTDNWDQLSAEPVEWLIVDEDSPNEGWLRAEPIAFHLANLFSLGFGEEEEEEEEEENGKEIARRAIANIKAKAIATYGEKTWLSSLVRAFEAEVGCSSPKGRHSQISNWLNGKNSPSLENFILLAIAAGFPPSGLKNLF
jgi:hypothetical protein